MGQLGFGLENGAYFHKSEIPRNENAENERYSDFMKTTVECPNNLSYEQSSCESQSSVDDSGLVFQANCLPKVFLSKCFMFPFLNYKYWQIENIYKCIWAKIDSNSLSFLIDWSFYSIDFKLQTSLKILILRLSTDKHIVIHIVFCRLININCQSGMKLICPIMWRIYPLFVSVPE